MVRSNAVHEVNNTNQRWIKTRFKLHQKITINKQETERILKPVQQNKVTAVMLQKNDTHQNKRQELRSLQRMVESKIPLGEEITVVVVGTN